MSFRKGKYTYEIIIHTGKKRKMEYLKWITGFRNLWERISEKEYKEATK